MRDVSQVVVQPKEEEVRLPRLQQGLKPDAADVLLLAGSMTAVGGSTSVIKTLWQSTEALLGTGALAVLTYNEAIFAMKRTVQDHHYGGLRTIGLAEWEERAKPSLLEVIRMLNAARVRQRGHDREVMSTITRNLED